MRTLTTQSEKTRPAYMEATGKLPYPLTNDYMFKALLQKNGNVLKHLICSMLHLQPEEVESVVIKNPIVLGEALTEEFDSKIFVLDLNVLLNSQALINLEMQVVNYDNWPERSLTYLCRNFDQLSRGEDYAQVKPAIHIGFLDFTLVPEHPEFYATYKMINEKNKHVLTDKFVLSVVDLKHIDLATQEDRKWHIDYWASFFKAATWEEMKMLAKQNLILEDAVETIYELTADEAIRQQCIAREKHVREMKTILGAKERAEKERARAEQAKDKAEQAKDKAERAKDKAEQAKDKAEQERDKAEQERDKAEQERDKAEQAKDRAEQERARAEQARDETAQELEQERQQRICSEQRNDQLARQIEQLMQENRRLKEQQTTNMN